jgi:hypothetical protein
MENNMAPTAAVLSITEERTYSAKLGDRTITGLAISSTWKGLTEYTDRAGQHLIVLDAEQRIITASPELIAHLGAGAATFFEGMRFGAPLGGGYFTGIIVVDGQRYALITAGVDGELRGAWSGASVEGATSRCDGLANTRKMAMAGSTIAAQAFALNTNSHNDWYIPSRDEQELQYRNLKPTTRPNYVSSGDGENPSSAPVGKLYTKDLPAQTGASNFRSGGVDAFAEAWYWSSTQHASYPSYAWVQYFNDGYQDYGHKDDEGRARVVRRLPI